ncbi:TonB-dependent receptor [Arenibacter sp. GZD96]|uniref:TonB-dependent receptor n=1 Tax=Aurantibrevibacter litoralis TaxID=3106030 RepID=UPI002AFF3055|nr:TonB-dependent receptor [Arenibacter sp. GZD-96]MEA1786581.1 TonB-dependent receptor [Arenibacter sp. GZD-96]
MKKSVYVTYCFLFFVFFAGAQGYTLSGSVADAEGNEIAFANVLLLSEKDSVFIKGTSSDEFGVYVMADVPKGRYLVTASYLGNRSNPLGIIVNADEDLGVLQISETTFALNEAVVTFKNPTLERKADRLVFHIENTPISESNMWDALKRTPGVVIANNELTIKGNSDIQVMINERRVNLPKEDIINLLSGTSAGSIEAIEVITSPPAKFSAEGGMIINIKMKKGLLAGYNGAVYNRYTQGVFAKHTLGTDQYFKSAKTDFSINYSLGSKKDLTKYTDITQFFDTEAAIWTANQTNIERQIIHNLSAFFDWELNEKSSISLSSINAINPWRSRNYNTRTDIVDALGNPDSFFTTQINADAPFANLSFYMDFIHQLKKEGASITVGGHYTYYDYELDQNLDTDFFDVDGNSVGNNDFSTTSNQIINLFSVQADYVTPWGEKTTFESGLRYTGITSTSTITQEGFDRNQPGINPTEAGTFDYDETIYAAYIGAKGKWEKLSLTLGLRAEYTEATGNLDIAATANEIDYFEVFPNFSALYTMADKHDLNLYYYRRITRPRYNSINPFQLFQSNNVVVEGNPELLPATRNYVALGYTYDKKYTLEFFYRNEQDPFTPLMFQDNDSRILRFINLNMEHQISYGVDAVVNRMLTPFWDVYMLTSFYQNRFKFQDADSGLFVDNQQFTWFLQTYNSFTFLSNKSLMADVGFTYFSPLAIGNSVQDSYSELGITFRKSFWNNNFVISMGLQDIFNQGNLLNTRQFLNQDNSTLYRPENRLFTFGLRYKFGNTRIKDNYKSKNLEERKRL